MVGLGADRHQGAWRRGQTGVVGMLDLQQQINGGPHRGGALGLQRQEPIGFSVIMFLALVVLGRGGTE
jgi:hypothetical protein